ncbi:MAG: protein kinase [Kofleriaceae bacterium]
MLGEVVGSYRITAKLAEGGMGAVYRAEHQLLGKSAAVKVLLPELSTNRDIVNRFFTEARAATSIRHAGIVEVFDFGYMPNGLAYIVMELLEGEPMSRVLAARGHLTEQEALVCTRGIASALAAAHAQGIVHRDLKPDNIFLVRDADMVGGIRTKILDFGIAKVSEAQRAGGASSKTRTGAVLGTPTYMSPEQCRGTGEVDQRSDLYSLGCILYEMLVGRPPFASEGIGEVLGMHLYMPPTPPSEIGVPVSAAVEALVLQLLQKKPEDRIQSATELARLLGHTSMPSMTGPSAPTMAGGAMATPPPLLTPAGVLRTGQGFPTPAPLLTPAGAMIPAAMHPTLASQHGANAPTTLSAAAGVSDAAPRRRTGLFVALGLAIGGGAIAAVVLAGGGGRGGGGGGEAAAPGAAGVAPAPVDAGVADAAAIDAPAIDASPPVDAAVDAPIDAPKRSTRGTKRGSKSNGTTDKGSGTTVIDRGD